MQASWTVVMCPGSGILILRRLPGNWCWLTLILKPAAAEGFSCFSAPWFMAKAKALSGSTDLPLLRGSCLSLGNNWYLRCWSGCCCILQVKGFSEVAIGGVRCLKKRPV